MKITMTLMLGMPSKSTQLWKADNGIGDVWYMVRIKGCEDKGKTYFTSIEFDKVEQAYKYLELKES